MQHPSVQGPPGHAQNLFNLYFTVQGSPGHAQNLFNLYFTVQGPAPDMFKSVHYEARTVGKWAVGIILECLLVTAHKRSLRRLCFHKNVSFCPQGRGGGGGGDLHPNIVQF